MRACAHAAVVQDVHIPSALVLQPAEAPGFTHGDESRVARKGQDNIYACGLCADQTE